MPQTNGHTKIQPSQPGAKLVNADEPSDIISERPPFFVRKGLFFLAGAFAVILSICWLIKLPNTLVGKARLMSHQPTLPVIVPGEGFAMKIFVKDNQEVKKGALIASLDTEASLHEVEQLSRAVDSTEWLLSQGKASEAGKFLQPQFYHLAELQASYLELLESYLTLAPAFAGPGGSSAQKPLLSFRKSLQAFRNELYAWKKRHLLVSPQDGRINLAGPVGEGQYLQAQAVFCHVVPAAPEYLLELRVGTGEANHMRAGQQINLGLPSPGGEAEWHNMRVMDIRRLPSGKGYSALLKLEHNTEDVFSAEDGTSWMDAEAVLSYSSLVSKIF
jgi:hypothetical protein